MTDAIASAESILRTACGDRVRARFPLAPLTSFRIGGPAALYLEPASDADLAAAGAAVVETAIPFVVLGRGSNVIVSDDGFPGLVIRLGGGYRWAARVRDRLSAGGAMPLPALAGVALRHGLSGLEFGVAIPATVGGAIRMNAGAHGSEMAGVLDLVQVFRLREARVEAIPAVQAGLAYRSSSLPEDAVVTGGVLELAPDDCDEIRARMDDARVWRRRTQPLAEPNCGSVFQNPQGDHAARLIEAAGGKGLRVGGAEVSRKHANFIVTVDGARATDVIELITVVQSLVQRTHGVMLQPEVEVIGAAADAQG